MEQSLTMLLLEEAPPVSKTREPVSGSDKRNRPGTPGTEVRGDTKPKP
jgi:hypothetical protein